MSRRECSTVPLALESGEWAVAVNVAVVRLLDAEKPGRAAWFQVEIAGADTRI